ncbi:MAG: hypothetical protein NTW21_24885 [Verrucomicrobia bacterium]|nr:hypothetical protein [Verrucomicrobiota bacterium]
MKFFGAASLTCLAVVALAASAVDETPPAAVPGAKVAPADGEAVIAALIADLSNDSFAVRETATRQLWNLGEAALEALKTAAAGSDPEAAHRAQELLHKIELHITPDTDPSVIALVERYKTASLEAKRALLAAMREKRAYRQILKLYAAETDAKLRAALQSTVGGIAIFAARERLLDGDAAGARELLELAPVDAKSLLALAAFHRANGTLEDELQRAKTSKAKGAFAWQLALQRAAGRLDEAQAAAISAGEPLIAATMAMLAGDPVPWLEHRRANPSVEPAMDLYTALALERWQGKPMGKTALAPTLKLLNSRNPSTRSQAFNSLFLLGEATAAEAAFAKTSPLEAFVYFEALERIPEALAALDLDPDKPDFAAWVATRMDRLIKKPDISDETVTGLVVIASFLENRGLHQDLASAFDKPLARLAQKNLDVFTGFLGALCGARPLRIGITGPIMGMGTEWAGDDESRWEELLVAAFGDHDENLACWKWLAELNPDATRKQRLAAMFALCGYGADPDNLRDPWLARAWAAITQADADHRTTLRGHLAYLIGQGGDAANCLKLRDQMPPNKAAPGLDGLYLLQLSAAGRWEDASQVVLKLLSNKDGNAANSRPDLHAYAAACLRRAGHPDAAAVHDGLVEKLALGDAMIYLRIGQGYAFGADYARCSRWWERAAREAAPDNESYSLVLATHATDLLKRGLWKPAAATAEVLAQIHSGGTFSSGTFSSGTFSGSSPLSFLRLRLQADQAHALSLLATERPKALAMLEKCHALLPCDGSLADCFFPALRQAGLIRQHDAWFETTWDHIQAVIARYPESHNTRNTAAWLASRAMRHLDEAEAHLNKALATHPRQAAYLDTMAELQFARGKRPQAIEWSDKSVNFMPTDDDVRRQNQRFTNDPLPE